MSLQYRVHGTKPVNSALTIGNMDGVHLGHKHLIASLCKHASDRKLRSAALTFDPAPAEHFAIINKKAPPVKILTTQDKIKLLHKQGIDTVIVLAFDHNIQNMAPDEFFDRIIIKICRANLLVLGNDFRFGKNRTGNIGILKRLGMKSGCEVETVSLLSANSIKISSSNVRQAMKENNLSDCNELLGHSYFVSGTIVPGDGRGKTIGFATANLKPSLPLCFSGVFASHLRLNDGRNIKGVTNIGTRPTFHGTVQVCETHLFNFDENIYNEHVNLSLHKQIREERKFASREQLTAQISDDIAQAHIHFNKKP